MSNDNGHNHEARSAIQAFVNRYAPLYPNGDHVELIQLAAFPVAVTVHLLYQIWANFGTFMRNGTACKIEALAVNDCIQSNLFRQTGPELFEMDANVRQCLLEDLRANRGKHFVKEELAAFLYQYSRRNTQGNAWKNYYDAQQWAAIMEVDEKTAAEQILSSLAHELQKKNTSRGLGIVNLISALEKDNKEFSGLLKKSLNKPDAVQAEATEVTSKRIVLTDEIVDGRQPVRINLPPSLSNKLKKIVKTDTPPIEGTDRNKEGEVYGLFATIIHGESQPEVDRIADILVGKQYIRRENITFLGAAELNNLSSNIDTLLSKSKKNDRIIIYLNCADYPYEELDVKITPDDLNNLIRRWFPSDIADVIFILEAGSIGVNWYELKYPAFTLISTGTLAGESAAGRKVAKGAFRRVKASKFERRLLESVLSRSDKDITYAEFYNKLLQDFEQTAPDAGIFKIPHLIPGDIDWNYKLFSKSVYEPMQEVGKLLRDLGHESETESRLAELKILEEGAREHGREKTISLLQIFLVYQQKKQVNCLWLLHRKYDLDIQAPAGISSLTTLWTDFFDETENAEDQDILKIVRQLFETNILFIGLTQKLLSGLDFIRWKTITNICKARKILVYVVVEESWQWQLLDIEESELLLNGTVLSDYLKTEGGTAFLKTAYKDIEEMLGQKEPDVPDNQGTTYGIFVGIDEYMDKQFNLHESVSDATKMIGALVNAELLDADNANLIINNEATRDNVVNLLRERLSAAKSEDTIIFYFSGHSSNQQTNSALFFHDLDRTSEYTSQAENGIMPDSEFNALIKTARNNPTIVLILDTHGGSRRWLDESNPKHFSLMATHLEEMCYELNGIGGMLTEALTQSLNRQPHVNYINLYQSVLNSFLGFAHEGNSWQTPLFVVHKDHWNDVFLSRTVEVPTVSSRSPKNYEDLQIRDTLQCLYYSITEKGAFNFYNQVKFALYEKRVDLEHLDSWSAVDKSISIHNRFPDMIFIGLKESMYVYEPKYNIEKLLTIADVMQIPVHFILEDESKPDPSVYKSYPLLPADKKPVLSGEDIVKLIHELEAITEPLVGYLKPVEEDYETWALCIGISHYENLPGLPAGVQNARRFADWLSGALKNKVLRENCYTFTTGSDIRINKSDIDETVFRLADKGYKGKERVLYIYVCGYAIKSADDFLLCLAPWAVDKTHTVVNITEYIQVLSNENFAKVIAFAEYVPIDNTHFSIKEEAFRSFTSQPATSNPTASCFFKVPLERNDDPSTEKNSIVLDGLYGEAVINITSITTESFTAYLHQRFDIGRSVHQLELSIKSRDNKDFAIANIDPLYASVPNSTPTFKQKWILVVGTGKDRLSQPEWMMSNALARELAKSGYGIITGGWPGVDAVSAEAYAGQLAEDKVLDEGYLMQIVLEQQEPVYPGGLIKRVSNETVWHERTLAEAYAVIMIGGMGGTFISYEKAEEANVPVIPISATGGDAAKAYIELEKRRLLPRHLLDELIKPLNNYDNAERTAAAICKFLDEGVDSQLNQQLS